MTRDMLCMAHDLTKPQALVTPGESAVMPRLNNDLRKMVTQRRRNMDVLSNCLVIAKSMSRTSKTMTSLHEDKALDLA